MAAVGGLIFGLGLGIVLAPRLSPSRAGGLEKVRSMLRGSVIPVLELRAESLGLTGKKRHRASRDPVELAVLLSQEIQRAEANQDMALSDTLEVSRTEFEASQEGKDG